MKTFWVFYLIIGKFLYRKSSIKPHGGGAYLILDISEMGLLERGGLLAKSNDKDIYDSFISSFTPYFADSTYNFASQIHTFDTVLSRIISKLTFKLVSSK